MEGRENCAHAAQPNKLVRDRQGGVGGMDDDGSACSFLLVDGWMDGWMVETDWLASREHDGNDGA